MTGYCEVVNLLLETFATDDVITEMNDKILHFTQSSKMTPTVCVEALCNKALPCDLVYNE